MQISLTWADAILSFAIGVIGSLCAAYLFVHARRYIDRAANIYAETTQRRAARRIERLTKRLVLISELEANTNRYIGFMVELIGRVISGLFIGTVTFVALTFTNAARGVSRLLTLVDPTYTDSVSAFERRTGYLIIAAV